MARVCIRKKIGFIWRFQRIRGFVLQHLVNKFLFHACLSGQWGIIFYRTIYFENTSVCTRHNCYEREILYYFENAEDLSSEFNK